MHVERNEMKHGTDGVTDLAHGGKTAGDRLKELLQEQLTILEKFLHLGMQLRQDKELVAAAGLNWGVYLWTNLKISGSEARFFMHLAENYHRTKQALVDLGKAIETPSPTGNKGQEENNGQGAGEEVKVLTVGSSAEVEQAVRKAATVKLPDGSPEAKFVREQTVRLALQVLALARKSKLTDARQEQLTPVEAAVVLLELCREVLDVGRVVRAEDEAAPPSRLTDGSLNGNPSVA